MRGIAKKRSPVWLRWLGVAALTGVVSSVVGGEAVLAQELAEKEDELAMLQYTLPCRFGKGLKAGDWVKYQIVYQGEEKDEIELKVTKEGIGGVWIVEKQMRGGKPKGFETHLLVDLKKSKLVEAFGLDEKGEKREATPLDEEKLSQVVEMGKKEMEEGMRRSGIIGWEKGAETEKVVVAGRTLECSYLEPEFSEEYLKKAEDYGMSVAEMKKKFRVYFSEGVPRLLPMMAVFGWVPFIEVFEEVKGGLVSLSHMRLELVGYGRQE